MADIPTATNGGATQSSVYDEELPNHYRPAAGNHAGSAYNDDVIDREYMLDCTGALKILEIVFSLITFICASVWMVEMSGGGHYGGGWVQAVSIMGFLCSAVLYILHIFKVPPKFPSRLPFKFTEFCYYVLFSLCFFSCGIVAAVNGFRHSAVGAAAFFSFLCTAIYCGSAYLTFQTWRQSAEGPYFSSLVSGTSSSRSSVTADLQY